MIATIIFPLRRSTKVHYVISNDQVKRGDIVVAYRNGKEEYGIVHQIEPQDSPSDIYNFIIRKADRLEVIYFWTDFEKLILKNKVKLSNKAYEQYRQTRGNEDTPREIAEQKLTRNLLLSYRPSTVFIDRFKCIGFQYGAMRMMYKNVTIHKIENYTKHPKDWKKNLTGYTYYSKLLGIEGL